jgi:RNA polymerase sigma factor (sigma-70 family)
MHSSRPIFSPSSEFDPVDLLARAHRLDRNALGLLHQAHYTAVYGYVHFRLADVQVCQEITAQVFQQFLQALRKRRAPHYNLPGWMFQTAARLVDQHLRKTGKFRLAKAPDLPAEALLPIGDKLHQSAGTEHPAGVEPMVGKNHPSQVYAALQSMPFDLQHFLALRFSQMHTLSEVAQLMEKPEQQVRELQQRALATLRKQLGEMP